MSSPNSSHIGWREVGTFLAELAVYFAIAWWSLSRECALWLRVLLAIALLAVFATSWGLLASPKARWPLRGRAGLAFRCGWFGLGLAAALWIALGP